MPGGLLTPPPTPSLSPNVLRHLGRPEVEVQRALFEHRILTGTSTEPEVLRLLPPLSFSHNEADILLRGLEDVLQ